MSKLCRSCKTDYIPSLHELAKRDYMCPVCRTAYKRAYSEKRKAAGFKISGSRMSPAYHKEYDAAYSARPEVKKRRAELARLRRKNPQERPKHEARWKVNRAIASGRLVRQPCEVCGDARTDAHHDDYAKPLDVRWLCRPHHREHHAKAEGGAA